MEACRRKAEQANGARALLRKWRPQAVLSRSHDGKLTSMLREEEGGGGGAEEEEAEKKGQKKK